MFVYTIDDILCAVVLVVVGVVYLVKVIMAAWSEIKQAARRALKAK